MKKIIAISLVAILAVGSVFAAVTLSGEAKGVFAYDIDAQTIKFEQPIAKVKATIEGTTAELVNEGDVYAEVKATLAFNAFATDDYGAFDEEARFLTIDTFKVNYAKIVGENWYVGILSAPAPTDFAASWEVDKNDSDIVVNHKGTFGKDYGIEVGLYDFVAGVAMDVDFKNGSYSAYGTLTTPEFAPVDGLTLQGGATFGNKNDIFLGFGGKVAYATDVVTADVAGDFDFIFKDQLDFGFDVAANVAYAPVTANFYFASDVTSDDATPDGNYIKVKKGTENYLSAKVVADLADINVPLSFTAIGQDLVNTQYFDLATSVTAVENLTIDLNGGYWVGEKEWHAGVGASYDVDKVGTVAASLGFGGNDAKAFDTLSFEASLTNTTLVSGATLKLAYTDSNYLADTAKFGKIAASAQIKF